MSETFFENPLYVYIALVFAELVLVAIWHERRSRRWATTLPIPLVLAVVVGLVAHLVVTDREQIVAAAKDIAEAVETRQLERIAAHLDEKFTAMLAGRVHRKADVVAVCNASISRWGVNGVKFHKTKVEITSRQAKMHVTTVIIYSQHGGGRTSMLWDVLWVKRSAGWRILQVKEPRQGFEL